MKRLLPVLLLFLALAMPALAQIQPVPSLMNFQGRLVRPDGTPVANGNYSLRFSLWNVASGGSAGVNEKWNQTLNPVIVRNGTFAVLLSGFPSNTFDGNLWLEIKLGSDPALTPRQQMVSVAYAMKADSIRDGAVTGASLANGSLTADKFAANLFNTTAWLLAGNSGTNIASHFLGTTDNQPLAVRTNNVERMRIQTDGRVGIGTNAPTSSLDVRGNLTLESGTSPILYTGTGASELNRYLQLINSPGATSASGLKAGGVLVSDSYAYANPTKNNLIVKGSIGIGTPSPQAMLHLLGSAPPPNGLPSDNNGLLLGSNGTASYKWLQSYGGPLVLNSQGNNVGIGTTTPGQSLTVAGNAQIAGNGNGLIFPDGTKQTTALSSGTGGTGGVPTGYSILGLSSNSPSGYTYTGHTIQGVSTNAGTWNTRLNLLTARYGAVAAVVNNIIYVIGGRNAGYRTDNEAYNPATNTWQSRAPMPTARAYTAAAVVNNRIYVIGGYNGANYLATNEEYNPATNTWQTRASMPTPRNNLVAVATGAGIYAMGGYDLTTRNTNEFYNPTSNSWSTLASLPVAASSPAAGLIGTKIYVEGGLTGTTTFLTTNQIYDTVTNTWSSGTPMPTARHAMGAGVINGVLYVVGGYDGVNRLAVNEAYNPSADKWTTLAPLPTTRSGPAVAVVNGLLYALGGDHNGFADDHNDAFTPDASPIYYIHTKN